MRFSYRDITSYSFDGRLPNEDEVKEFDSVYYLSLVNCVIDSFQFCVDYADKYAKRCCGLHLYNCEVKDWSALEDMSLFKIGIIETDMTAKVKEKYEAMIADGITPIKRMGQPEDIAKCVAAVADGNFDFCTGTVIDCDGGFSVRCL